MSSKHNSLLIFQTEKAISDILTCFLALETKVQFRRVMDYVAYRKSETLLEVEHELLQGLLENLMTRSK